MINNIWDDDDPRAFMDAAEIAEMREDIFKTTGIRITDALPEADSAGFERLVWTPVD